jgi:hypothetical protein
MKNVRGLHAVAFALLAFAIAGECTANHAIGKDGARAVAYGTLAAPRDSDFRPLEVPAGAVLRGLSLSGRGVMHEVQPHQYKLESGCAMLQTDGAAQVEAGPGIATISANTTAVVHVDGDATRFVNLTDHRRHSMRVSFGKHFVDMDPGFELVLVKGEHLDPKALATQEHIGFKDMRQMCTDHLCVFLFRVSAADVITHCKIYRQLAQSPLDVDRVLREQLIKSVAALETMYNKRKGPYKIDPFEYRS